MREGHGVGLVAHAQALPTVLPGVLERVANDALHALSGVDVLLNGNFGGGVLIEDPAEVAVQEDINSRKRSEEHTSELQSRQYLVCRLLLEKKNIKHIVTQ